MSDSFVDLTHSIQGQPNYLDLAAGDNLALVIKTLGTNSTDHVWFKFSAVATVVAGPEGPEGKAGSAGIAGPTGPSGGVNNNDIKKYSLIFG